MVKIKKNNKSIIDETLHYPDFLDNVKTEVVFKITKQIDSMIKRNINQINTVINLDNNRYFDKLILNLNLNFDTDINDKYNYGASSISSETIKNEKLSDGEINLIVPVSTDKKTNFSKIQYVVCHEITHLFDDWNDLKRGGTGIFSSPKTIANMNFMNKAVNSPNNLIRSLRWLAYFSIYTESNAFTQQLMQELIRLKANHITVKEKYKNTVSYNNLKKTEVEFFNALHDTNHIELMYANNEINRNYKDSTVPKLNDEQFDSKKYYNMLKKWGERILHKISKRFHGIVQLYCDKLTESYYNNNCFLIHE